MSLGSVERGCGGRVPAGIYAEVPTGPNGRPLEDFLIDPPLVIPAGWGVAPLGVTLVPDPLQVQALINQGADPGDAWNAAETWHVIDLVGAEHYPNVADVLEEGRRFGFSRRLASTTEFRKLGPGSRLILGHARAQIDNPEEYRETIWHEGAGECPRCPKGIAHHGDLLAPQDPDGPKFMAGNAEMCVGLYWHDLDPAADGTEPIEGGDIPREAARIMPGFHYRARIRPEGIAPQYRAALFINLPLTRLAVIADPEGGRHVDNLGKARQSGLHVNLEDE